MQPPVMVDRDGPVATLRLNQPDRRNALGAALVAALSDQLRALDTDSSVRALVLTGQGGVFCAGGDLAGMKEGDPLDATRMMRACQGLVRQLVTLSKPVVAAVDGAAFGAGFSLALACDWVVVAPGTRFCAAFGKVGLMPDLGLLWSLPQRLPMGRVRELLMLCEIVGGDQAVAEHIADQLVADGQVLAAAQARAARLADAAPGAVAAIRSALAAGPQGLEAVLRAEEVGQAMLMSTRDHVDARQAFFAKAPIRFQGR